MSHSYQKRCLERDQLENVNRILRYQTLVMAKALTAFEKEREYPCLEALKVARKVTGMPEPTKRAQMRLGLNRGRAA